MLIDTHCHIQDEDYPIDSNVVMENALNSGVSRAVVVGTDLESSRRGIEFAEKYSNITGTKSEAYAVIGVHPSNANLDYQDLESIYENTPISLRKRIIGVGEIGLDYHYNNSSQEDQIAVLRAQIQLAIKLDLPIAFHVRDAYDDFWRIFDEENKGGKIRGILHSFTDCFGYFCSFSHSYANVTVFIAHDDQCGKPKISTALNNLGYTIYSNQFFF